VTFKRLLETETGLTTTEPGQMAVTEAIEKAVEGLIIEGVRDGLWVAEAKQAGPMKKILDAYESEKTRMSETDVYGIRPEIDAPLVTLQPYAGVMRYYGDYARHTMKGVYGASLDVYFSSKFGIQANAATGTLASEGAFSTRLTSLEGNLIFRPTPFQHWTSLLFIGAGMVSRAGSGPLNLQGDRYLQAQGGVGIQYSSNGLIGFRSTISYNQPFTDALDGITAGTRNDYYLRGTLGLTLNIGSIYRPKRTPVNTRN
jgi:curli production assembly/transport component CsgG